MLHLQHDKVLHMCILQRMLMSVKVVHVKTMVHVLTVWTATLVNVSMASLVEPTVKVEVH